jgi:hypothetical protein
MGPEQSNIPVCSSLYLHDSSRWKCNEDIRLAFMLLYYIYIFLDNL